jgi:hypothetical protein
MSPLELYSDCCRLLILVSQHILSHRYACFPFEKPRSGIRLLSQKVYFEKILQATQIQTHEINDRLHQEITHFTESSSYVFPATNYPPESFPRACQYFTIYSPHSDRIRRAKREDGPTELISAVTDAWSTICPVNSTGESTTDGDLSSQDPLV